MTTATTKAIEALEHADEALCKVYPDLGPDNGGRPYEEQTMHTVLEIRAAIAALKQEAVIPDDARKALDALDAKYLQNLDPDGVYIDELIGLENMETIRRALTQSPVDARAIEVWEGYKKHASYDAHYNSLMEVEPQITAALSGHAASPVPDLTDDKSECETCEGYGKIQVAPDSLDTHPCEDCQPERHAEWKKFEDAKQAFREIYDQIPKHRQTDFDNVFRRQNVNGFLDQLQRLANQKAQS